MHVRTDMATKMGGAGGVRASLGDPVAERWPARAGMPPGREKERRRSSRAMLVACLITLPFLAFFLVGRESASVVWHSASTKLTVTTRGFINASCAGTTAATTKAATVNADELLGGLLTPGLDRRSCRSRYEASHYYKHFPYPPSSPLLLKLRAYEARHKKCAPGTPLYAKSVEQLSSGRSTSAMECNYIVWLPFDGLGNRMLSILSGFLYALLSDRVLLVALPEDSSGLFCEPFPGTTWVLPPDFPVANMSGMGPQPDQSYTMLLKNRKIPSDPAMATAQSVPPYVYLSIGYQRQFMDTLFFCSDGQRVLAKVNWLLLYSDLYFAPSMYAVPEFQDELRRLFPAKESVAHLLGRYLFHPTNPVWGLVTRYYRSYLAPAKQRIGVQIRMLPFATIRADDMYNQILACSRQEHVLPEVVGANETAVTAGDLGTATTGEDAAATADSKAILVVSLYAEYYERLKSMYYDHEAQGGVRVGVFQPTHEERQLMGKLDHNQKALAEIYVLSFSDVLLTSGMSTFGYVSSSLAGVRPTILITAWGHKVQRTPCLRAVSMEPCNLTPPVKGTGLVECPANKAVDKDDLNQHVKFCEDDQRGVKLYN